MGGVAAALAAARRGCRTCLLEETDWLGGQLSAQGVSALDEHEHIEIGRRHRQLLRPARGAARPLPRRRRRCRQPPRLQPGRLLGDAPRLRAGRRREGDAGPARTARRERPAADLPAQQDGRRRDRRRPDPLAGRPRPRHRPGDPLPRRDGDRRHRARRPAAAGGRRVPGRRRGGRPRPARRMPNRTRPRPIACRASPTPSPPSDGPTGERHVIHEPARYRHYREAQPYSLTIDVHGGEIYGEESGRLEYRLYDRMPGTKGGLWTYRRLLSAETPRRARAARPDALQLAGQRLPRPQHHRPARGRGRGQPAGRQAGEPGLSPLAADRGADHRAIGRGAPEIMLRPDAMGTADGLSKHPYIRESRRIVALKTIVESEVSAQFQTGPVGRALRRFGRHRLVPDRHPSLRRRRRRPQLPHEAVPDSARRPDPGAPRQPDRGLQEHRHAPISPTAATGCIRSSGTSARRPARSRPTPCKHGLAPAAVRAERLAPFQQSLVDEGVPLAWPESLR